VSRNGDRWRKIISYHIPELWKGIFLYIIFSISVGFVPPSGKTVLERQWAVTSGSEVLRGEL